MYLFRVDLSPLPQSCSDPLYDTIDLVGTRQRQRFSWFLACACRLLWETRFPPFFCFFGFFGWFFLIGQTAPFQKESGESSFLFFSFHIYNFRKKEKDRNKARTAHTKLKLKTESACKEEEEEVETNTRRAWGSATRRAKNVPSAEEEVRTVRQVWQ